VSLQQQIEALELFDREYRARLTAFMQGQLRALWVDQPQVDGELEQADVQPPKPVVPAQRQAPAAGPKPANGTGPAHAPAHANGPAAAHVNGTANGNANGAANGNANGAANGNGPQKA
jgi:hypothetical protein